ncbi:MAG TPA: NAD(+)/NADH kinase [Candidatus Bathyarchaeota archaeon]|nr:NAD(+)/NADH kinase [Candidatus Bathyarchaeota archaeon]
MSGLLRSVGIVANLGKRKALGLARELASMVEQEGLDLLLDEELASALGRPDLARPVEAMSPDLLVIIGGDGTVLRTCLRLKDNRPLIMAINMGGRGFLTTVEPDEALSSLRTCLSGAFSVEERMRIKAYVDGCGLPEALNEVCLTCRVPVKLFKARIWKDGQEMAFLEGDGLIIATPSGSTAYSLSCGGPIVDPGLRCLLITPICPIRPLWPFVLPPDAEVVVEVVRAREPAVVVDGQEVYELQVGSKVRARASDRPLKFVKIREQFYERLAKRGH